MACGCYFGWSTVAGRVRWGAFITFALLTLIFAIAWQVSWNGCEVCWFTGEITHTAEVGEVHQFECRSSTTDDLMSGPKESMFPWFPLSLTCLTQWAQSFSKFV